MTSGPVISLSGSRLWPTRSWLIRSMSLARNRSAASRPDWHRDADRHAALAPALPNRRRSTRRRPGRGVGVGHHDHVVLLRRRSTASACPRPGRIDVLRDVGALTKPTADVGVVSRASTAPLSPCTTWNTPSAGRLRGRVRRGTVDGYDGSASLGLSMKAFPQHARRDREHPQRDHRREVERGDPGDHAEGWRIEYTSMPSRRRPFR